MTSYYNKDLIAERDSKAKMTNAVIKFWQVNYQDRESIIRQEEEKLKAEEATLAAQQEEDEALKLAAEINARLEREATEYEAQKQAEIEEAMRQADATFAAAADDEFNATTGSYSGSYGKNVTLDEAGLNQVDSILGEKDDFIKSLFANAGN